MGINPTIKMLQETDITITINRQTMSLPSHLIDAVKKHGLTPAQVEQQLQRFSDGFPELEILQPATIGNGILQISGDREKQCYISYEQAQNDGRTMKFCPASGAASRMFKTLQTMLVSDEKLTEDYFNRHPDDPDVVYTRTFLNHLDKFAFFDNLGDVLRENGLHPDTLLSQRDYRTLISFILEEEGLGLAFLPKALIPFHTYSDHCRTPLEEQLVEAVAYARDKSGYARIHFTISPEHERVFKKRLSAVRGRYETDGTCLDVDYSFQKPETDTIAADSSNQPFLDDDGNPVFRPGGHGALLANLQELNGDIIFIKNIDNVAPDRLKEPTIRYKKLLGGVLALIQDEVFSYLRELEEANCSKAFLDEVMHFIKNDLFIEMPHGTVDMAVDDLSRTLFDRLNRPIRACGIVINQGEPGGGPFLVRHSDGAATIQIIEDAQINMENPDQKKIFQSATHFSPTDLACGVRDFRGNPFRLRDYRDPETGFISHKSYQGRDLKALELPGLWNGSMTHWITILVEVPVEIFTPVKTACDLLRDEHQNS